MINVSVVGSHVLKRSLEYLGNGVMSQKIYAPKISLASATGPKVCIENAASKLSALDGFSREVIVRDLNKTLVDELIEAKTDIVFIDFFDEVFNYIVNAESGACLTSSNYFERIKENIVLGDEWRVLVQSSSEAWAVWEVGCRRVLEQLPARTRPVLVKLYLPEYFLDETDTLRPYSQNIKRRVDRRNDIIDACYRRFESICECISVDIDREMVFSQTPEEEGFHPTDVPERVYSYIASQLSAALQITTPVKKALDARVDELISMFNPIIGSQDVPTIAELHRMAVKCIQKGDFLKAQQCERLITLVRNSSVPNTVEMGNCTFGYGGVGVIINGNCKIGDYVNIGSNVTLGGGRVVKDASGNMRVAPHIEDRVYIATGAKILGGVVIGHHSIVGANAVVTKDIPPFSVVGGIPGRVINTINRDNLVKYSFYLYKGISLEDCARYMFGD